MLLHQLVTNASIFFIGFFGTTLSYNNSILTILMGIELMLLSCNLNFITYSLYLDDAYGQIFSIVILTVAASESAIGLAILIISYRLRGNIDILANPINKG
jgi:NADH-quinone oxidoreductase subunit K